MLQLDHLSKTYRTSEVETRALSDISLAVDTGEFLAIIGPSGCGKSTLLNILGFLDSPSEGSFRLFGEEVSAMSEASLTRLRRAHVGFVFQSFNLVDELTVEENVEVGLVYREDADSRRARVRQALEKVDIDHRAKHRPQQLSGGQQQRVAIARALVSRPKLILADEPTGNLDTANGEAVMGLLTEACADGTTVIMVTHSPVHAAQAKRTVKLLDGKVVSETIL